MKKPYLVFTILLSIFVLLTTCNSTQAGSFADAIGTHYATASWTENVRTPSDAKFAFDPGKSYAQQQAAFAAQVNNIGTGTIILQAFGGREYESVSGFLNTAKNDPAGFEAHWAAMAQLIKGKKNVYVQIGNEINNGPKLSPSIHQWLGDGLPGAANDVSIIPTLDQYWIRPIARGLRLGDPDIQIILGSVANAAGASAFIESYLAAVGDISNHGSIHYSMIAGAWQTPIDQFTARGMNVWSTEEVGGNSAEKGMCMVASIKGVARLLSYNPSGKMFVWGAGNGPNSCDQWMPVITAFAGAEQLAPSSDVLISGTGLEAYQFALGATGKRLVFIQAQTGNLTGITGSGTVYVFRGSGVEQYALPLGSSIAIDYLTSVAALVN